MKYSRKKTRDRGVSMQLLNAHQKEEVQEEHDWLSEQFTSFSYMIYKFWLVITFVIALSIQPNLILSQFKDTEGKLRLELGIISGSSILALLSCGEMLFAMMKRKSAFAQKSFIKLQYSLIGAILGLCTVDAPSSSFDYNKSFLFEISIKAFPASLIVAIFGGSAVLKTFKRNHPLARLRGVQDMDLLARDFLEQNKVIESEVLKYDEQLERWPLQIYKFWLKLVIVIEIIVTSSIIFFAIPPLLKSWESLELLRMAFFVILCSFAAFCCYEMEVVLRTKVLEQSKKVLVHLRICILLSILVPVIFPIFSDIEFFSLENLGGGAFISLIPLITLIGAFHINKIIEQRDQFAKVSSYSGDHYL